MPLIVNKMTLQEAKDQIAKTYGLDKWPDYVGYSTDGRVKVKRVGYEAL